MDPQIIFISQTIWSFACYALVARWYVAPRLARMPLAGALVLLSLPHLLRPVGATFLVPGVVGGELPTAFAVPAAYGDILTALLTLLAIVALRAHWPFALGLVWLFNVIGAVDLVNAYVQGARLEIPNQYILGATWLIPTFLVPGLLVLHAMAFAQLITRTREYRAPHAHVRAEQPA
jgi:hypothetical protein